MLLLNLWLWFDSDQQPGGGGAEGDPDGAIPVLAGVEVNFEVIFDGAAGMVSGAVVHIVSSWLKGGAHVLNVLGEVLVLRHTVKIGQVLDKGGDLSEISIVVFLLALFNSIITNLPSSSTLPEMTKQMVVMATSTQLRQLLMQVNLILQQTF